MDKSLHSQMLLFDLCRQQLLQQSDAAGMKEKDKERRVEQHPKGVRMINVRGKEKGACKIMCVKKIRTEQYMKEKKTSNSTLVPEYVLRVEPTLP